MPILTVRSATVCLDSRTLVGDVSFEVQAGEVVALVGPNGAGKTTLLRALAGVLALSSGEVRVQGRLPTQGSRREWARQVAYVPAEEEEASAFRVRDIVALGRHPWRGAFGQLSVRDNEQVERALGAFALTDLAGRALGALSCGERQRVSLARAVAQDARVLLLDEPTAHQDLGRRLDVMQALRGTAVDRAVVVVLHDLTLAGLCADRVVLLAAGRLVASGSPTQVLCREVLEPAFGCALDVLMHPSGNPIVLPALRTGAR